MKKYFTLTLLAMLLLPMAVSAQSVLENLCELPECIMDSGLVLALATVAILFLGIGAFFGKVNWGLVFVTGIGIVVVAGAFSIASLLLPSATPGPNCGNDTCDGIVP